MQATLKIGTRTEFIFVGKKDIDDSHNAMNITHFM